MPGSHIYYHLYFLDRFRREGAKDFSPEEQKHFDQFQKQYPYSSEFRQVQARLSLLKYDNATTDAERQATLQHILHNYLGLSFEHYKPDDYARGGDSEPSSDVEDSF